MANTFDSYYDIQPYRSFRDLDQNEGFPGCGLEDEIPDEFLEDAINEAEFSPFLGEYPPIYRS